MLMIKDLIKSVGLKATPQRIAIYESMRKLGHACADMVVEDLREKYPTLTVATIYNVLESFVEAGLLVKRFSLNHKTSTPMNTHIVMIRYTTISSTLTTLSFSSL